MAREGASMSDMVRRIIRVLAALLMAGGFAVLVYINVNDWYSQYLAEQHISEFTALYNDENDPERLHYKEQALAYNEMIAGIPPTIELLSYAEQLFYQHEPMMSYIEIPKIAIKLPIYHGTDEDALMAGVGHLEGTSLPIGDGSVQCVLTGHSGMRNTRMFDDLRKLERGDIFLIWTLNEPYAYQVYDIETVLPEEVESRIELQPGRDLVTLMTCTPYGVNTHRLLVHAERCDYTPDTYGNVGYEAYVNDRNLPLLLAMGTLLVMFIAWAIRSLIIRSKKRKKAHMKAVKE